MIPKSHYPIKISPAKKSSRKKVISEAKNIDSSRIKKQISNDWKQRSPFHLSVDDDDDDDDNDTRNIYLRNEYL